MKACRSVCGPTDLMIPARPAIRRTIRAAPCRSSRRPSAVRKTGPSGLLVTGDKAGKWNRWYAEAMPRAEHLYEIYLKERAGEEAAE